MRGYALSTSDILKAFVYDLQWIWGFVTLGIGYEVIEIIVLPGHKASGKDKWMASNERKGIIFSPVRTEKGLKGKR